jgi:WD40 repeat protein/serine/threonine protein kinase
MSSEFPSIDETSRRKFESAWLADEPEAIEHFLPDSNSPAYMATLEELIHIELEFAWQAAGDRPDAQGPLIEDYLQRFSGLDDPEILLRLIEQESSVRHRFGTPPLIQAYRLRFPEIIVTGAELPTIAPRPTTADKGDRLAPGDETDQYRIDEEFARGGFGEILTVFDKSLKRTVALKQLSSKTTQASEFRRRFLNEARITAYLEHPGVVPVYALHEPPGGEPYYTMKLVRGDTLAAAIERFHATEYSTSEHQIERARLLAAFLTVANTMAFSHSRDVIHRDLKPANIILGQYGETLVLDWGLAKKLGETDEASAPAQADTSAISLDVTQQGDVLGTPVYMSPEQASGATETMDQRCDVYAMGAILYEMLTGHRPYSGRSSQEVIEKVIGADLARPRSISPGVPRPLEAICLKAMAENPDDRYPSASELAGDVERYLADQTIGAYHESLPERSARWLRRHRTLGIAAAVGLVVVAAVAISAAVMINQQKTRAISAEGKAVAEESKTRQALGTARDALYITRISNAQHEWAAGYTAKADTLLQACDADQRQWEWRYINRLCNSHVMEIRDGDETILGASFSPDGTKIATGGSGGLCLWGAASGKLIWRSQTDDDTVRKVRFSKDSKRLYALGKKWLKAHDASDAKVLWKLDEAHSLVTTMTLSPSGKYVMLFNKSQQLMTIRAESGQVAKRSAKLGRIISALAYSRTLKRKAVGHYMFGDMRLDQLGTPDKSKTLSPGQRDVYDLAFSDDELLLASAAGDSNTGRGSLKIWDAQTGKLKCESTGQIDVVTKVTFAPGNTHIISAGHDRKLTIWSIQTGKLVPLRAFRTRGGRITDMSLDYKNRRVITVNLDGLARVWDLTRDQEYLRYGAKFRDMLGAAFGNDSRWFVDATSVARSTRSVEYLGDLVRGGATSASGVAASSDGKKFAIGAGNGMTGVWRIGEFPVRVDLKGHSGRVTALAFSPDSQQLVTGSDVDSDLRLWDIEAKKTIQTFGLKNGITRCVAFSPDGKRILAVRRLRSPSRCELKDWNLDGSEAGQWHLDGHNIYSFAFSKDGKLLATGDQKDGRVVIWNAQTRQKITEIKGHQSGVSAIGFMPDGLRLVTAGDDRAAKLWDTQTWTQTLTLDAGAEMDTMAISPDGNTIVLVDHYAHRARIWNANDPEPVKLGAPWRKVTLKDIYPNMPDSPAPELGPAPIRYQPRRRGRTYNNTSPGPNITPIAPTTAPAGPGVYVPGADSSGDIPPNR